MGKGVDRILICSDDLPPSEGGVEYVVQNLASNLADIGYEVGVFTLDDGVSKFYLEDVPGVTVYAASAVDLTETIGLQSTVSVSAFSEFGRVVREFQPDIVHAHNRFFLTSTVAALYSLRSEYELVTTLHLGDIGKISGIGGATAKVFEQTASRFVISRSTQVISVSDAVESIAQSLGATRSAVVRNAVDLNEFTPHHTDEKSLLFVGRFVHNNGVQDLATALPDVLDAHPDMAVHFAGSGPMETTVRRTIESNGLSDVVTMHGYVDDLTALYDAASVFCRPSYSEGLPLTMLEAMASGVPPVVTAIAGVPEVVTDRETGILLEPGDPERIGQAVTELFDDTKLRHRLSQNAREYVSQNHSWEQRTKKVIRVYNDALS